MKKINFDDYEGCREATREINKVEESYMEDWKDYVIEFSLEEWMELLVRED